MPTIKPTSGEQPRKRPTRKPAAKKSTTQVKPHPSKAKVAAVVAAAEHEVASVAPMPGAVFHPNGQQELPAVNLVSPSIIPSRKASWLIDVGVAVAVIAMVVAGVQLSRDHSVPAPPAAASVSTPLPPVGPLRVGGLAQLDNSFPVALTDTANAEVSSRLFESLVHVLPDGTVSPWLAASYTQVNRLTWDVSLVAGATYHNGRPVTAADVKASLDKLRTLPETQSDAKNIASITVVAPDKLRFRLTKADPQFLAKLGKLPLSDPAVASGLVGTGAYMVKPNTTSAEGLLLTPYTSYRDKTKLGSLDLQYKYYSTSEALVAAASKDEVDVIASPLESITVSRDSMLKDWTIRGSDHLLNARAASSGLY